LAKVSELKNKNKEIEGEILNLASDLEKEKLLQNERYRELIAERLKTKKEIK
jgi:hypothetical protein